METLTEEFDESDAGSLKMPKVRSLLPARKYRESVKKWGEPTHLNRRRVFIVPSIKCAARDVNTEGQQWNTTSQNMSNTVMGTGAVGSQGAGYDLSRTNKYKDWMTERKKLRGVLSGCGLNQDWLAKKNARTELESRVLKRLLKGSRTEQSRKKVPAVTTEDDADVMSGQDRGVPTIRQPAPAALAMIQEYLDKKKLRLLDLFAQADKDKNWVVSRNEFRNIIKSSRIPLTEADLEDLILALDKDDNDSLDYRELALGRQAFLDERIRNLSAEVVMETKPAVRSDVIAEESESPPAGQETRPSSPQRPSSPTPSHSPTATQRPDSSPHRPGSLPSSPRPSTSSLLSRSSSTPLLMIPPVQLSEKVEQLTQQEIKEKRMNKQRKRKEKEKSKQKKRGLEKLSVAPSTLGGATGQMIDKYRRLQLKEYNESVELCYMHGVQLDKKTLERVLLQPEDKPVEVCKSTIKRGGLFSISTRHHAPPARNQSPHDIAHGHTNRTRENLGNSGSVT